MKRYVIAYVQTGEIVRAVRCYDESAAGQAQTGEVMIEHEDATWDTHYVLNGVLTAYTGQQAAAKSAPPASGFVWSNATMAWEDTRPLREVKQLKLDEMKAAAQAAGYADITLQGNTFAADADTQAQLMNEALLAQMAIADNVAYSLDWERTDGSAVTLTANQLKALIRAIRNRNADVRQQFRSRRTQIQSATTKAEVEAITW